MVRFSPDGKYFAVYTERGRLEQNAVEDCLRFYRSQDVENFLEGSDLSQPPSAVWIVNRSDKEGPVISGWRWLPDSSGVAFLEGGGDLGERRLVLADLRTKKVETLTSRTERVEDFDIRDREHYVYTVTNPAPAKKLRLERHAAAMVGTDRSLVDLILPVEEAAPRVIDKSRSYLRAVIDGKPFKVKHDGDPLVPFTMTGADAGLALSPDGQSLVAMLPVSDVPSSWGALYPPPNESSDSRIHVGGVSGKQFVRIILSTGSLEELAGAPTGFSAGWESGILSSPSWSSDGEAVLLPSTFLPSKDHVPSRPCVAVVDLPTNTRTCVEVLTARNKEGAFEEVGSHFVKDVWFIGGDKHRVMVRFYTPPGHSPGNTEYRSASEGIWEVVRNSSGEPEVGHKGLEIRVEEGFDRPPLLVARGRQASRVIWDPNPQLKDFDLGQVSIYKWKDHRGRDYRGLLYKPSTLKRGEHYPLVIQTHGFSESHFDPAGYYPAANAARELATTGIVVLQVGDDNCATGTLYEEFCAVSAYEGATEQLVSEGLVDPEKIGIIGFSRTCFYVMETLTAGSLHLKAASTTDGTMIDYWQYLAFAGRDADARVIGAQPFGEGLQQWLKRSPSFNLHKVGAPLLVVGEGRVSLLFMWGLYAGLRYLQKPVDLVMLNTDEHVLTNPAVRMASQSGSVDWFRFWLKGEEDPSPAKEEQYRRWRELRDLQEANEKKVNIKQPALN
jgi:dipeptidyl aminopeptidase/acylaminoacyl peptidase